MGYCAIGALAGGVEGQAEFFAGGATLDVSEHAGEVCCGCGSGGLEIREAVPAGGFQALVTVRAALGRLSALSVFL
jgi:hypothetical protein